MGAETLAAAFPVLLNAQRSKTTAKPVAGVGSMSRISSTHGSSSLAQSVVSGSARARDTKSLQRADGTTAGSAANSKSSNKGRSRLEFVGMALALHLLFGRKMREIIFMTKNYAIQAFSFGLQYLQKPWLLFSRTSFYFWLAYTFVVFDIDQIFLLNFLVTSHI